MVKVVNVIYIYYIYIFTTINTKIRKEYSINNPYQKKLSPLLERGTEGKKTLPQLSKLNLTGKRTEFINLNKHKSSQTRNPNYLQIPHQSIYITKAYKVQINNRFYLWCSTFGVKSLYRILYNPRCNNIFHLKYRYIHLKY